MNRETRKYLENRISVAASIILSKFDRECNKEKSALRDEEKDAESLEAKIAKLGIGCRYNGYLYIINDPRDAKEKVIVDKWNTKKDAVLDKKTQLLDALYLSDDANLQEVLNKGLEELNKLGD